MERRQFLGNSEVSRSSVSVECVDYEIRHILCFALDASFDGQHQTEPSQGCTDSFKRESPVFNDPALICLSLHTVLPGNAVSKREIFLNCIITELCDVFVYSGNSDVHNGPAHYYEDIAPSSNIGNSDVHNGPAHIMWTLPRVQTLELSTIQGSDKEHLEAKPQLWKLVYRSASGYRNAIPSWIKRLLSSKTNVYIEGL
ncbi:hypothetical protein MAR_002634 [Mya arenaria]|uniref:Uncharacterized protein n=1 Tax=Mya arenaria TaxID=6604 RepID=A0ABY7GCY6_MYAAR|nr:hypothetical protein MAR_002634 [Mya arenaria]